MMKKQTLGHMRGFTLIELLVVIAIIGILASVVLASLNTARDKGADAAAKSSLNNMRAQAELVYDGVSPNSYETVCENSIITTALTAAGTATGGATICADNAGTWAAQVALKATAGSFYCVDSTGKAAVVAATTIVADTDAVCN